MFSNLSLTTNHPIIHYPQVDTSLAFSDYINQCKHLIQNRRINLHQLGVNPDMIVSCNSPFEMYPANPQLVNNKVKYGVLLIHGLFDCPFTLRDLAVHLQNHGILSRAILLPGHGTEPSDLITTTIEDWMKIVQYGIKSLQQVVEHVYLLGFSTGASLSVYQALQNNFEIAGLILLAPAIKIKGPIDFFINWNHIRRWYANNKWVYRKDEIDYTRYLSIAFNPVNQVSKLTSLIAQLNTDSPLNCPMLMAVSREDETISSRAAIQFFTNSTHSDSQLLLYTSKDYSHTDERIEIRKSNYEKLKIYHLSHTALPFAPGNPHYGQHGDYPLASHIGLKEFVFGAYNDVEISFYDLLTKLGIIRYQRRDLTYNPDFDFLAERVLQFILHAK